MAIVALTIVNGSSNVVRNIKDGDEPQPPYISPVTRNISSVTPLLVPGADVNSVNDDLDETPFGDAILHLPVPHAHASFGVQSLPSNAYSPSNNDNGIFDDVPLLELLELVVGLIPAVDDNDSDDESRPLVDELRDEMDVDNDWEEDEESPLPLILLLFMSPVLILLLALPLLVLVLSPVDDDDDTSLDTDVDDDGMEGFVGRTSRLEQSLVLPVIVK